MIPSDLEIMLNTLSTQLRLAGKADNTIRVYVATLRQYFEYARERWHDAVLVDEYDTAIKDRGQKSKHGVWRSAWRALLPIAKESGLELHNFSFAEKRPPVRLSIQDQAWVGKLRLVMQTLIRIDNLRTTKTATTDYFSDLERLASLYWTWNQRDKVWDLQNMAATFKIPGKSPEMLGFAPLFWRLRRLTHGTESLHNKPLIPTEYGGISPLSARRMRAFLEGGDFQAVIALEHLVRFEGRGFTPCATRRVNPLRCCVYDPDLLEHTAFLPQYCTPEVFQEMDSRRPVGMEPWSVEAAARWAEPYLTPAEIDACVPGYLARKALTIMATETDVTPGLPTDTSDIGSVLDEEPTPDDGEGPPTPPVFEL